MSNIIYNRILVKIFCLKKKNGKKICENFLGKFIDVEDISRNSMYFSFLCFFSSSSR